MNFVVDSIVDIAVVVAVGGIAIVAI